MRRLFLFVSIFALVAASAQGADLTLKRVTLSSAGLGLYEYETEIDGNAAVELRAPLDQVDDILKSLVVFDDNGGVGGLDLPAPRPLADAFRDLPFTPDDLQSTPQLLAALRGAEVEVGGPRALKGRIVSVSEEHDTKADGGQGPARHRVAVLTETGLSQFVLEDADGLRFSDPALAASLAKALKATATGAERNSRVLRLTAQGEGKRTLHVAYLAAAPIWKASYRLALTPDKAKATLQGWATLENLSGQDWRGVDLTLVSGRPVAFKQALYRIYQANRPEAPVDVAAVIDPGEDQGEMETDADKKEPAFAPLPAPATAVAKPWGAAQISSVPHLAGRMKEAPKNAFLGAGAAPVAAQEGETQVAFHLPHPVTVEDGRTLSLPIVDRETPVARVAIYDPNVEPTHPMSAAELTNDSGAALPPGLVTLYERSPDGAAFVGDARLSATPPGEKRLLAYALDFKTTVVQRPEEKTSLIEARVARGLLTLEDLVRDVETFRVKADAPRKLIVYAVRQPDANLTAPDPKGVTEADGRYRAPFDVQPGVAQKFEVVQERRRTRAIALASLDGAALATYATQGDIGADTRASLQKLSVLRAAQADAARALEETRKRIEETEADQSRLKDLLGAAPAGSDLAKRYLKKLDADENDLDALRHTKAEREKAHNDATAAVAAFIAGL